MTTPVAFFVLSRRSRYGSDGRRCGGRVLGRAAPHPHRVAGVPQEGEEEVRRGRDAQRDQVYIF